MRHDMRIACRFRQYGLRRLRWVVVALFVVLPAALCSGFPSGVYVISATFNGGATVSVPLGSSIEIAVTAAVVGSEGTDSWWCSTRYVVESSQTGIRIEGCAAEPSPEGGCYCNWGCLAASWQWESEATARFLVPAPSIAGTYDVTLCAVSGEGECRDGACMAAVKFAGAIVVTCGAGDTPAVELGSPRTLTCMAPSATLTAALTGGTGPFTYLWTPGGATTASLTVTSAGTYFVRVTGSNGCSTTDTVTVAADLGSPVVDVGGPYEISCAAAIVVLDARVSGGTAPYAYLWTPGNLTTQTISVTAAGTYDVKVTCANGCSASASAVVTEPSGAANLVSNGDFEAGLAGWTLYPNAGSLSSPVFSVSAFASPRDTTVACLDLGSAWLQSGAVGTSGPAMLIQDVTALLTPGASYRLSCWMREDAAAGSSPTLGLLYATSDGVTPADGVGAEARLPLDAVADEWTFCQSGAFTYALPPGCTQAWLALLFPSATGTAWWDNVSLVALGL